MQATENLGVFRQPDDPGGRAERLGLAKLASFGVEVGPADRIGPQRGHRIGHNADDAAEKLAIQRMPALIQEDCRMPADGVGAFEDVADRRRVDAPNHTQILLAGGCRGSGRAPR